MQTHTRFLNLVANGMFLENVIPRPYPEKFM